MSCFYLCVSGVQGYEHLFSNQSLIGAGIGGGDRAQILKSKVSLLQNAANDIQDKFQRETFMMELQDSLDRIEFAEKQQGEENKNRKNKLLDRVQISLHSLEINISRAIQDEHNQDEQNEMTGDMEKREEEEQRRILLLYAQQKRDDDIISSQKPHPSHQDLIKRSEYKKESPPEYAVGYRSEKKDEIPKIEPNNLPKVGITNISQIPIQIRDAWFQPFFDYLNSIVANTRSERYKMLVLNFKWSDLLRKYVYLDRDSIKMKKTGFTREEYFRNRDDMFHKKTPDDLIQEELEKFQAFRKNIKKKNLEEEEYRARTPPHKRQEIIPHPIVAYLQKNLVGLVNALNGRISEMKPKSIERKFEILEEDGNIMVVYSMIRKFQPVLLNIKDSKKELPSKVRPPEGFKYVAKKLATRIEEFLLNKKEAMRLYPTGLENKIMLFDIILDENHIDQVVEEVSTKHKQAYHAREYFVEWLTRNKNRGAHAHTLMYQYLNQVVERINATLTPKEKQEGRAFKIWLSCQIKKSDTNMEADGWRNCTKEEVIDKDLWNKKRYRLQAAYVIPKQFEEEVDLGDHPRQYGNVWMKPSEFKRLSPKEQMELQRK